MNFIILQKHPRYPSYADKRLYSHTMSTRNLTILLVIFCGIKLALHVTGDYNSGFQGDELLHIQTGNHPDIGYMEFPPVIGWLAFLQNQFHSSSVFVHHIFTHIASLLIMIVLALTTVLLGGKNRAVIIVLVCVLVAPAFGRSQQLFQPVVFSQLAWVLAFYQLARFVKTTERKYLFYLTLTLVFGVLSKYDAVFFIGGLGALLFFPRMRLALGKSYTWKYMLLFMVLIIPNIYWQYEHDFPVLQMFSRLYETQLDKLSIADTLTDLIVALNPLTAMVWIGGLIFMFRANDRQLFRPLAFTVLLSITLLAISRSKFYYFFPSVLTLLVFGGVWLERLLQGKRQWIFYPVAGLLILSGLVMIPFGLAVLPLDGFIKLAKIKEEDGRRPVEFAEYYGREHWSNTLTALREVYDSLPAAEKQDCLIWGKHYRQAGAVNLFRTQYELPVAFSYHGSFYLWAPSGKMPATVIAFTNGEAGSDFFENYFSEVIPVKKVFNKYADDEKDTWQTIYICKQPKQNFDDLKEVFRKRIFE